MEMIGVVLVQEGSYKDSKGTVHGNLKLFGTEIKVNTCTNFVVGCSWKQKMEKLGF